MGGTRINWRVPNDLRVIGLLVATPDHWFTVGEVAAALNMTMEGVEYALGTGDINRYYDYRHPDRTYHARDKAHRINVRLGETFARRWGVEASLLSTAAERKALLGLTV